MAETSRFSRRVFFVEDDGTIRRISSAAYERLLRHDPATVFPKVPGRAVRCAFGDVEIIDWRPTEIYSTDFVLVYFDSTGALDRKREAARKRLVDQIIRAADRSSEKRPFAGRNHPACKRMEAEFQWRPSEEMEAMISQLFLTPVRTPVTPRTPRAAGPRSLA